MRLQNNATSGSYPVLSGDGIYGDSYDSHAKCMAKCDADSDCFAYSWKVSYTECKTYSRLEVADANLDGIVGAKSAGATLGHDDTTCYFKRVEVSIYC